MAECGTTAGWNQHMKDKTPICPPCRKAKTIYTREQRRKKYSTECVRGLGWPKSA